VLRRQVGENGRQMILREKDWRILAQRYAEVYDFASAIRQSRR
jgi:hypothetical protein